MTRIALLAILLFCALSATAQAAMVTGNRGFVEEGTQGLPDTYVLDVRYQGFPGEANDVRVTIAGNEVTVEDAGAEIEAGGRCTQANPSRVVCSSGDDEVRFTHVILGDGDDRVEVDTDETKLIRLSGNKGDDTLQGGISSERLIGGEGDDLVDGGAGSDTVIGGPGRDELRGGEPATPYEFDFIVDGERDREAASDTIVGHPEQSSYSYASRRERVTVDLPAGLAGASGEQDSLTGISRVLGGKGPDIMLGTGGGDFLLGGPGADRIEGRRGNDSLLGQDGRDRVFGGDGDDLMSDNSDDARDVQSCGRGEDWVASSDKRDLLQASCEDGSWLRTRRLDTTDEVNRITVQPAISRRRAVFRSTCASRDGCDGRITLVTARTRTFLGQGRIEIERARDPDRRHHVVVRLNARGREHLRRGGYVRVVISPRCACSNLSDVNSGFTTFMQR